MSEKIEKPIIHEYERRRTKIYYTVWTKYNIQRATFFFVSCRLWFLMKKKKKKKLDDINKNIVYRNWQYTYIYTLKYFGTMVNIHIFFVNYTPHWLFTILFVCINKMYIIYTSVFRIYLFDISGLVYEFSDTNNK